MTKYNVAAFEFERLPGTDIPALCSRFCDITFAGWWKP